METYLPIIKTILAEWLQLTLTYPLYAAALATAVWLLTAIIYSIKVVSLKKAAKTAEKAHIAVQNNLNTLLNTSQQQIQLMQEELTANTEQMQKDQQLAQSEAERANRSENLLSQRNQQVAWIIQALATGFDLGERPLPVMADIKAEDLWQQHDRVINLLTTRLRNEQQAKTELQQSYQTETLKRTELESVIETLQTTLATKTRQVSSLEQMLEEQKSMFQQQQDKAQQALTQTQNNHLLELTRLTELQKQALELNNTRQQLTQVEEKFTAADTLITEPETIKPIDQVKVEPQPALVKLVENEAIIELKTTDKEVPPAPSNIEQPVNSVKEQTSGVSQQASLKIEQPSESPSKFQFGKLKNLLGSKKQPSEQIKQAEADIQPVPLNIEQPPVSPVKTSGVTGKLKNLFGKTKQEPITAQPESVETRRYEEAIQPAPSKAEQLSVYPAKDQLRNLPDSKQQPEETKQEKPEIQPAPMEAGQPPVSPVKDRYGKTKYYFGDINQQSETTKQDVEETQPSPAEVEKPSASPAEGQLGKLKNLFGSKQKPKDTKQVEEAIKPAAVEMDLPPVSPAKGKLAKFKNLFGKAK